MSAKKATCWNVKKEIASGSMIDGWIRDAENNWLMVDIKNPKYLKKPIRAKLNIIPAIKYFFSRYFKRSVPIKKLIDIDKINNKTKGGFQ